MKTLLGWMTFGEKNREGRVTEGSADVAGQTVPLAWNGSTMLQGAIGAKEGGQGSFVGVRSVDLAGEIGIGLEGVAERVKHAAAALLPLPDDEAQGEAWQEQNLPNLARARVTVIVVVEPGT